ncbi:hypothetical protein GCM10027403_23060 [Arthrobacter tecti]
MKKIQSITAAAALVLCASAFTGGAAQATSVPATESANAAAAACPYSGTRVTEYRTSVSNTYAGEWSGTKYFFAPIQNSRKQGFDDYNWSKLSSMSPTGGSCIF